MICRKILTLFVISILLPFKVLSQSQFKILDGEENAVPYAHVFLDDMLYTHSDDNGEFKIDTSQKFQTVKVTHLSYKTALFGYNAVAQYNVIRLEDKATILNQVSITASKKKRKKKIILPERAPKDYFGSDHDLFILNETDTSMDEDNKEIRAAKAVYIPNEDKKKRALITKIILNSVDNQDKVDAAYVPFTVNLMTYDTITKLPKEKIFSEDLAVGKKKGEKLIIDLSDVGLVEFPKEGICIVVSVYSTLHYNNKGFLSPPKFDAVSIKKSSDFREYYSFYGSNWKENAYSQAREQCFNFGIEAEYIE